MSTESKEEWVRRCAKNPGAEWRLETREGDVKVALSNKGIFDELVVDHWLHMEQLSDRVWWMRVGDARLQVSIAPDGTTTLDVQRGFYGDVAGVTEKFDDT